MRVRCCKMYVSCIIEGSIGQETVQHLASQTSSYSVRELISEQSEPTSNIGGLRDRNVATGRLCQVYYGKQATFGLVLLILLFTTLSLQSILFQRINHATSPSHNSGS